MVYIGIDVGGTNIGVGIVSEEGKILHKDETPTLLHRPFEEIVADMARLSLSVLREAGFTTDDVKAVGIGIPGIADPDTGMIVFCTNLGWQDVPMREAFQRHINKPVFIDNDATVAGLAESVSGVSAGAKDSIFLTLGTGVGAGIIINGAVYAGAHHIGSEIGHMIVQVDGLPCTCGNHGCWERYASATAIIRMGREALDAHPESLLATYTQGDPEALTAKHVFDAAKAGDPAACAVFDTYVKYLSQGIASLINCLDPEVIALGGGVSKAGDFLLDAVRARIGNHVLYKRMPFARVELALLGNDAGIIGAAMLGR